MDWKSWYRAEAASDVGRARMRDAIARWPEGDPDVRAVLREGGAASFPHTTLTDSAEPLSRVATSILAEGFARVVALGVLHGSTAPLPQREQFAAAGRGDREALGLVGGAFTPMADAETPFGCVTAGPAPRAGPWVRPGGPLLANEFSLDLFLTVLAAAAAGPGARAPTVSCLFIGPTDPTAPGDEGGATGSIVESIAGSLRPLLGPDVALVATGDLVHAGHGYAPPAEVDELPRDRDGLTAHFEPRVAAMLDDTFQGAVAARRADAAARELRSDMRHLLPVLAAILGRGSRPRILSFRLSDYGGILHHPPPCVVASALVAYDAAGAARVTRRRVAR